MGIIFHFKGVKQINEMTNVQNFTVVNTETMLICVSLWNEMIDSMGHVLVEVVRSNSVIVAKRLAIKSFQATEQLKAWFRSLSDSEIEKFKSNNTTRQTKELVVTGKMTTHIVAEVTTQLPGGDYWVTGSLLLTDTDQQLYYVACGNCNTKLRNDAGEEYVCFICKEKVIATLRPIVVLSAADQTSTTKAVALEKVAEQILQTTREDMLRLIEMGQKLELASIKAGLEDKRFLMFLSYSFGTSSDTWRRLLLLAYFDDSTSNTPAPPNSPTSGSSSKTNETELPISPLKRQMSEFSINSE
ncbi:hypothetical protein LIER_36614 [Lithospermum erythrorhizon]|uniref:Replication factor A C-terminal domain-containing protein n=1 Tax=Lithospermum erythrorhizon TaxID=34254 RepID=A0AAV3PAD7_LITER